MASTASSTTAQRGVLSQRSPNIPANPPSLGSKTGRAGVAEEVAEALLQQGITKGAMSGAVHQEAGLLGRKRGIDSRRDHRNGRETKRLKGDSILQSAVQPDEGILCDAPGVLDSGLSDTQFPRILAVGRGS